VIWSYAIKSQRIALWAGTAMPTVGCKSHLVDNEPNRGRWRT
jgi:hypothetical protein